MFHWDMYKKQTVLSLPAENLDKKRTAVLEHSGVQG